MENWEGGGRGAGRVAVDIKLYSMHLPVKRT